MSTQTRDSEVGSTGKNVLAELDQRVPTSFYWSLTLLGTIGGFLFGYDTANIGSALPFIPYSLNGFALGYLVAGASLGAAIGALAAGRLSDKLRRESLLVVRRRIWTPGVKRALIVVCVFFIFQQISGINVPLYYGPKLLGPLFQSGSSKVATTLAGVEVTAIIAAVNVIATYFAFRWIDRMGRRKISIGGYTGMCIAAIIAAVGLLALTGTARVVLVMIALNAFVASFAVGVSGAGWLIQGESLPTVIRGQAAAIAAGVDWAANFALIEVFPTWQSSIGLGWIMICFAAISVIAIGFIYRFLPETKNRSVEEITQLFEEQAAGNRRSGAPPDRGADAAAA
jgi:MFS family permease